MFIGQDANMIRRATATGLNEELGGEEFTEPLEADMLDGPSNLLLLRNGFVLASRDQVEPANAGQFWSASV